MGGAFGAASVPLSPVTVSERDGTPPTPRLRHRHFRLIRSHALVGLLLRSRRCLAMGVCVTRNLPTFFFIYNNRRLRLLQVCELSTLESSRFATTGADRRPKNWQAKSANPTPRPRRYLSPPGARVHFPRTFHPAFLQRQQPLQRSRRGRPAPSSFSSSSSTTHPTTPHYTTTALASEQNAEWPRRIDRTRQVYPRCLPATVPPSPHYRGTDSVCCWLTPVAPTWYSLGRRPPRQPFSSCFPLVRGRRPGRLSEW